MSDSRNNTGNLNTGYLNTGDLNTGYLNTGDLNTGNLNTGNRNTGNLNTGYRNTGYLNTGNLNTGNRNTGNLNTGYLNTGNLNTGNLNTGNRNTGDWNTGNRNTGYLNTGNGPVRLFDKDSDARRGELVFPDFFYHETAAVWVPKSSMTPEGLEKYKTAETTGGYLKKVDPLVGWRTAWGKADDADRRRCFDIPNWDNEKFKEISGIDVEAELSRLKNTMMVGGRKFRVSDIEKALAEVEEVE